MNNKVLQTLWGAISFGLTLTSIVMLIIAPEYTQFVLGLFSVSFIILFALIFVNRKLILDFVKTKYFRNLTSNIFTIFLTLGIFSITNYLIFKNNRYFDLTKQRVHTLSQQSKSIVKSLQTPLKITLFARRQNWDKYLNLLNLYKYETQLVSINVVDVDSNPSIVQLNNIKEDGTVLIEYNGKKAYVKATNELVVTNLIIKIMRSHNIVIYYTVGHGELNRNLNDQNGASYLFQKIVNTNYILRPLDLLSIDDIPIDANLLMILGPQNGFLDLEVKKISNYLSKGGNLLLTLAPEMSSVKLDSLYDLLKNYGVNFVNSIVLDRLSTVQGTQATIPIVTEFNPLHSITKKFKGKVLFPLSAALIPKKIEGYDYKPLLKTNAFPGSWAETSFDELKSGRATYDQKDLKGPIDLAATIENKENNSRLIVTSSSSFVVNGYQSQSSNFNLFLNILSWGVDDEGIISLNRPDLNDEKIILSANQITLIFYFAIGLIPFILFAIAIYFYRRRLKK